MGHLSTLYTLHAQSAPIECLGAYVKTVVGRKSQGAREKWRGYREVQQGLRARLTEYDFSTDWFTGKIPYWLGAFEAARLKGGPLNVLEIGSWEGLSSLFILETFPGAHITCVDLWEGSVGVIGPGRELRPGVEARFDANLAAHRARLTKRKESSLQYFGTVDANTRFDLIYVDGSHHGDDVMVDAVRSFALLKVGGVIIFDDYLADYYDKKDENPAAAINLFLHMKKGRYEFLAVYYQLILRKIAD